jgi:hypothetical protein
MDSSMDPLILIASRVEAAVKRYNLVCDISDRNEWKEKFDQEKVFFSFKRGLHLIPTSSPNL